MSYEAALCETYASIRQRLYSPPPRRVIVVPPAPPPAPPQQHVTFTAPIIEIGTSWRDIAVEVCVERGVTLPQVLSTSREGRLVLARHEICYRLRYELGLTLPVIGRLMRRDQSTVGDGIRRHEARMAEGQA